MRLSNGQRLIRHSQFLEKLMQLNVDKNGILHIKPKRRDQLDKAVILKIGGIDIFNFSSDDQSSC